MDDETRDAVVTRAARDLSDCHLINYSLFSKNCETWAMNIAFGIGYNSQLYDIPKSLCPKIVSTIVHQAAKYIGIAVKIAVTSGKLTISMAKEFIPVCGEIFIIFTSFVKTIFDVFIELNSHPKLGAWKAAKIIIRTLAINSFFDFPELLVSAIFTITSILLALSGFGILASVVVFALGTISSFFIQLGVYIAFKPFLRWIYEKYHHFSIDDDEIMKLTLDPSSENEDDDTVSEVVDFKSTSQIPLCQMNSDQLKEWMIKEGLEKTYEFLNSIDCATGEFFERVTEDNFTFPILKKEISKFEVEKALNKRNEKLKEESDSNTLNSIPELEYASGSTDSDDDEFCSETERIRAFYARELSKKEFEMKEQNSFQDFESECNFEYEIYEELLCSEEFN